MSIPKGMGKSNNPAGRPPKGRALAERLSAALSKSRKVDGKNKKKSVIIAEIVVDAIIDGVVILPGGREVSLEPKEWIDLTKFVFLHVDGPVKAQLELSTDKDHPLIIGTFDYAAAVAEIATGSSEDSESSGED